MTDYKSYFYGVKIRGILRCWPKGSPHTPGDVPGGIPGDNPDSQQRGVASQR